MMSPFQMACKPSSSEVVIARVSGGVGRRIRVLGRLRYRVTTRVGLRRTLKRKEAAYDPNLERTEPTAARSLACSFGTPRVSPATITRSC
jgi:hypothetical protein